MGLCAGKPSHEIAVHHEVGDMVNGTESRRQAEIREKRHLKDQRQGQGLLAAHENNAFASARPYPKEPTAEKSKPEKNTVKHEGRQTHDQQYASPCCF